MDDGTAHAFGRIEGKLDRLFDEVSSQGRTLAEHGIRLAHVEDDVEDLKTRNTADDRHGITVRGSIFVGLCTVVASGILTSLVTVLVK